MIISFFIMNFSINLSIIYILNALSKTSGVSDNYLFFESRIFYFIFKSTIISSSIMKSFINSSIIFISTFLYFVFSCFIKFKMVFNTLTVVCLCIFLMLCVIAYWVNSSFTLFVSRFLIPLKFLDSNNVLKFPSAFEHLPE